MSKVRSRSPSAAPGAIFAFALAAAALQTGRIMPRPLAFLTVALGVVLLSPLCYINTLPGTVMIAGVGALSVALLRTSPTASPS